MTWTPHTAEGKWLSESLVNPLNLAGKVISTGANAAGDFVQGKESADSFSGMAGNFVREAIPQAIGIGTVKYAPEIATGTRKVTDALMKVPVAAMRGARNVVQPHLWQSGLDAATGRSVNLAAGDKAPQVMTALETTQSPVAGVNLTAGQASVPANSAEFAALQKRVEAVDPSKYAGPGGIEGQQQAARQASIQTIGQDAAALKAAIEQRSQMANPLYDAARKGGDVVNSEPVIAKIDKLLTDNPGNTELVVELNKVKKGLTDSSGQLRTDSQQVSSVLDGMKKIMASEDNKFILGHLKELKKEIADSIPGYQKAQTTFKDLSPPVNQMQVGQYLERKLNPALDVGERATSFAQAVRDAPTTIKNSTGQPRYAANELGKVLEPSQMKVIDALMADLKNNAEFANLSGKGGHSLTSRMGDIIPTPPPSGMLNRMYSLYRAALGAMEGKATGKIMENLAGKMDNPAEIARLMREATPAHRQVINSIMAQRALQAAGTTVPATEQQYGH